MNNNEFNELIEARKEFDATINNAIITLDKLEESINKLNKEFKDLIDYDERMKEISNKQVLRADRGSIGGGDI